MIECSRRRMDLTITLSERSATKLLQGAVSSGCSPTDYASNLIERALESAGNGGTSLDSAERQRLRDALLRRLKESDELAPSLTGPVIDDLKRGLDDAMEQEAKKQGLRL